MSLTGLLGTPASQPESLVPAGPVITAPGALGTVTITEASATAYLRDALTASVTLTAASATIYLTSGPGG